MSVVESLSVLSLCMFKTVRLLNRCWLILERSHVFSLREAVKYLSPAALVAGFTKISLHNGITCLTSLISSRPGLYSLNYSVYLSARLSLPVTLVTFDLIIFCYFGSVIFVKLFFCYLFIIFAKK